jgi:hypothetical protein
MSEPINDASKLVIGRRYVILTDEPGGAFRVGAFVGWQFTIAPDESNQPAELVTELPEGWEARYPHLIFENAEVGDYWALDAHEGDDLDW